MQRRGTAKHDKHQGHKPSCQKTAKRPDLAQITPDE
jgi:hypothetical protein